MIIITCPECGAETKLSLVDADYEGARKCWKCRGLFKITIRDDKVVGFKSLSEEEFEQEQDIYKLKNKFRKSD